MALEAEEGGADGGDGGELGFGVFGGAVFEGDEAAEFVAVEFVDALGDVLGEDEIEEGAEFFVVGGVDGGAVGFDAVERLVKASSRSIARWCGLGRRGAYAWYPINVPPWPSDAVGNQLEA